jgi:hypothetical protein
VTRPLHEAAIDALAHAQTADRQSAWDAAQAAHDEWADEADDLGLCLTCEAPSPEHAYCPDHR